MSTIWRKSVVALLAAACLATLICAQAVAVKPSKPQPPPEPPVQYAMTYVGVGSRGMNNVGDVVGSGIYLAEKDTAYDVNVLFFADLAEQFPDGAKIDAVSGINDPDPDFSTRQIAGTFRLPTPEGWGWAYAFRGTIGLDEAGDPIALEFTPLPLPEPQDNLAEAMVNTIAINYRGDIAGGIQFWRIVPLNGSIIGPQMAIVWPADGSGFVEICPSSGDSIAVDINDAGQVTGRMTTAGETHAYRYSPGTPPELLDLGGLRKQPWSMGKGINSLGQVTGFAVKDPHDYGRFSLIRYTNGVGLEDLGSFFSATSSSTLPTAINTNGQIVGSAAEIFTPQDRRAGFLYTDSTGFLDLATLISNAPPELDPESIYPTAINDFANHTYGQILVGTNLGAYVLTPNK